MNSAIDVHSTRSLKGIFRPGVSTSGRRGITGLTRSRNLIEARQIYCRKVKATWEISNTILSVRFINSFYEKNLASLMPGNTPYVVLIIHHVQDVIGYLTEGE